MKFERLRLTGFKSFCDAAEFKIEAGLTGVVGPNGCGKSNLVEALRWVMGESSFKNMRGSGMEDVIFAGSAQASLAQQRRGRAPARQLRPTRAGRLQRFREDRGHQAHRTRRGFDLPRQRQGGARARRAAPVRRRVDRRALAFAGAPGADRGDHFGQAPGAPADPGRGRGRLRPPLAPPRSGAEAEGRGGQSRCASRTCSSRSTPRSTASSDRRVSRAATAISPRPSAATRRSGASSPGVSMRRRWRRRGGGLMRTCSRSPSARVPKPRRRDCRRSPPPPCPPCARKRRGAARPCTGSRSPARRSNWRRSAPRSVRPSSSAASRNSPAISRARKR